MSKDELLVLFEKAKESYIKYYNSYDRYYELDDKGSNTRYCIPIICRCKNNLLGLLNLLNKSEDTDLSKNIDELITIINTNYEHMNMTNIINNNVLKSFDKIKSIINNIS